MRRVLIRLALASASIAPVIAIFVGCSDPIYVCASNYECWEPSTGYALCLGPGDGKTYCAYPWVTCPSRWQWDSTAPKSVRGRCVDPALIPKDGGADAGGQDGAPTDAGDADAGDH